MGKGAGAMRPITPQQNTKMRLRMRLLAAVLAVQAVRKDPAPAVIAVAANSICCEPVLLK